jgi:hypothetical protein
MPITPSAFWRWFRRFATKLTPGEPSDSALDELVHELHKVDSRLFFEISTNTAQKELIITASGNADVFPVVDALIAKAPKIDGWSFIALKPPMGFDFVHSNNRGLELNVKKLWFLPLQCKEDSEVFGLRLAVPSSAAVVRLQSVDTAYTILSTALGERSYASDIGFVELADLPKDPAAEGYAELPILPFYIEARRRKLAK